MRVGVLFAVIGCTALAGCAKVDFQPEPVEARVSPVVQRQAMVAVTANPAKRFKRKIAIGRVTNETRYGRTFSRDSHDDPLGKQVGDMLSSRLVESGQFLVFERPDIERLKVEQAMLGGGDLVGVETLILGSLTEFGRSTTSRNGLFMSSKMQKVHAKLDIRLADPRSGHVIFSASGQGEASSEAGGSFTGTSEADYDQSLNDKAIGAAISDLMNTLVSKLGEQPWRTDILKVEGNRLFISGGQRQGLKVGDTLAVMRTGEKVKSGQSGLTITLPSAPIATIRVTSLFGDSETNEGALAETVTGSLNGQPLGELYVAEMAGG